MQSLTERSLAKQEPAPPARANEIQRARARAHIGAMFLSAFCIPKDTHLQ